ncbi:MAG TPA: hypothetical protein VFY09_07400, partial [Flavobacteriaceae bacterium]|nr:hypothetical protein [Flavobacteriaceae bacterium]
MQEYYNDLISIYLSLPLLIQVIWVVIFIEILLILSSFINLNLIRRRYQYKIIEQQKLTDKYQEILINYIYFTEDEIEEKNKSTKLLKIAVKNKSDRKVIQDLILTLHNDLTGELAVFLETLY